MRLQKKSAGWGGGGGWAAAAVVEVAMRLFSCVSITHDEDGPPRARVEEWCAPEMARPRPIATDRGHKVRDLDPKTFAR